MPPTDFFYAAIETAYNRGIIIGEGNNTFNSPGSVTRAAIAKIVTLAINQ